MPGTALAMPVGDFHTIEEELYGIMAISSMTLRVNKEAPVVSYPIADEPAALMLDHDGKIHDCNGQAEALFGFQHDELVSRPIALLLPQLNDVEWIQNGCLNPRLSFICHIGRPFNAVRRDGSRFATRLFFHDLDIGPAHLLRLIIRTESLA